MCKIKLDEIVLSGIKIVWLVVGCFYYLFVFCCFESGCVGQVTLILLNSKDPAVWSLTEQGLRWVPPGQAFILHSPAVFIH